MAGGHVSWCSHMGGPCGSSLKKHNLLTFKEMNSMKGRQNRLIDKLRSFIVFSIICNSEMTSLI